MGFMFLWSRKRFLSNDIMSETPSKRIKLEFQNDGNPGNDDLWGQDEDITAEQFDLLEIQATQSCNQNNSLLNNNTLQANNLPSNNGGEVHDLKQLRYELEGKVKLLSLSLEKTTKELNEERLNKDRIINEKIKQFYDQEVYLKKEVEKMQSILEFKEQEMKSTYSKLQILKSQLKDKKDVNAETSVSSNFEDFLKSSKCDEQSVGHDKAFDEKYHRKYKLTVDISRGEVGGMEILSSVLSSRLSVPSVVDNRNIINFGSSADSSFTSGLTSLSVLHLKNEHNCDEILEYYCTVLKNHVTFLKCLASKKNRINCNKNSQISMKGNETFGSQTIVSYLRDIAYIYSSQNFQSCNQKCNTAHQNLSKNQHILNSKAESSSHILQNETETVSHCTASLFQQLTALSKPETYPTGYYKNEEMEYALSALLNVCLSCSEDILELIEQVPCYFLSNPHQNVTSLCTTVKLLIALCPSKSFISHLAHKDSNCILCLIATFFHMTVPTDPGKFTVSLLLLEDFLTCVLLIHNYKENQLLTSNCMHEVIQGMIKSLWKYFQIRENHALSFEILRKGFLLLHFISSNIPSFKENRTPVEDEYISLISGILTLSKENGKLKEFYDLIHNLWDFQTDVSEFDLDEFSEETHSCTNDIDIE